MSLSIAERQNYGARSFYHTTEQSRSPEKRSCRALVAGFFSFGMAPLTSEMAVNSPSRPFGRKSVAAVAEPAKFKAEKANKGHKQEPAASKKGLERPVSFTLSS
jgi:hypothetical protein